MTALTALNDLCSLWALADGKANLKVKIGEMSLNSGWWQMHAEILQLPTLVH